MKYVVNGVEYTDLKEAEAAEEKLEAAKKAKENAVAERKADLVPVNNAATAYLNTVRENNKKRAELNKADADAYAAYKKELDTFAEKYDGYHLTYKINGDNIEYQIEEAKADAVQKELDDMRNRMRSIYSDFFDVFRW